jgi:predicted nuclease of predicted toxin-antitoxin system
MRWLVDECVDARIVPLLRADGHNVLHAAEVARGTSDVNVLRLAVAESRLLLSEDKDFGDLVIRRRIQVPGIVLLRVQPDILSLKWSRLRIAIEKFGEKLLGRCTVVEEFRFRSRGLTGLHL